MIDISIQNPAVKGSPLDNTMMPVLTEKAATSSSFSERLKNNLGFFFPFTMDTRTGDENDTQEEDEEIREIDESLSELEQIDS